MNATSPLPVAQLDPAHDAQFERDMLAAVPKVKAVAFRLFQDSDRAADLVQDTMERAWKARANFQLGTNMAAWLCFIARNQFYSEKRRSWRSVQMPVIVGKDGAETSAAELIAVPPRQGDNLDLEELQQAIEYLPAEMREALRAVAVDGLSYEEAAVELGTETGTIKSRVSRGRRVLDVYFGLTRKERA